MTKELSSRTALRRARANKQRGSFQPTFIAQLITSLLLTAGVGAPSFTRASPAAVTDFEGVVRTAKSGEARFQCARRVENLHTATEDFTNAAWVKQNVTAAAGSLTGSSSTSNVKNVLQSVTMTAGGTYIVSADFQASGHRYVQILLNAQTGYVNVDLQTGTVTASSELVGTVSAVAGGYYRVAAKFTPGGATNYPIYALVDTDTAARGASSVSTGTVLIRKSQLENVTGQSVQTAGEYVSVGATKQNLLTYSEDLTQAVWSATTATVAITSVPGPSGIANACLITSTGGSGSRITQTCTAQVTGAHYYFVSVKKSVGNSCTVLFRNNTTATNLCGLNIDFTNGATTPTVGTGQYVVDQGNGWYQCVMPVPAGSITAGDSLVAYIYAGASSGAIGDAVYATRAQIEQAVAAGSYYPVGNAYPYSGSFADGVAYFQTRLDGTKLTDYGPELVKNGGFAVDLAGTAALNGAALTQNASRLCVTPANGQSYGAATINCSNLAIGKTYLLSLAIASADLTSVQVSGSTVLSTSLRNGVYTAVFTATQTSPQLTVVSNNSGSVPAYFDNVSVRECPATGYGPELITNGTLTDNLTGWTPAASATLSVVGGNLRVTNGAAAFGYAYQAFQTIVGRTYVLPTFKIGGVPSNTANYHVGTSIGGSDLLLSADASGMQKFVATSTTCYISIYAGSNVAGNYTDYKGISVREVLLPIGFLTEGARTNICLQSQNWGNAAFTSDASGTGVVPTVTANYGIAPDGTQTACRLQLDKGTGAGFSRRQQIIAGTSGIYTDSVWLKTTDGSVKQAVLRNGLDGVAITVSGQWKRYSVANSVATTSPSIQVLLWDTFASSQTADLLVWQGQCELGSQPSTDIFTGAASGTRSSDVLSYPTAGNLADAAGTVYAETCINAFDSANGRIIDLGAGGALAVTGSGATQIWDGSSTTNSPIALAVVPTKRAAKWSGSAKMAYANGVGVSGTFDGSFGLGSSFTVGNTAAGNTSIFGVIRNVQIWLCELMDLSVKATTT